MVRMPHWTRLTTTVSQNYSTKKMNEQESDLEYKTRRNENHNN